MVRKLRLEFPGACYHVINRGNYRTDIFRTEAAKRAFETCLFEACEKSNWLLHAFGVMRNHYHLAVETPEGNLVAGMQWLQSTFANRFNRFRAENGHVFQGRYKALLVEEGQHLGMVCHYIHLNPVRAHVLPLARLEEYRYSSYWYLSRPQRRPRWLRVESALFAAGKLADTPAGWASYRDYLAWQVASGPAGTSKAYVSMSRGWVLGSAGFKTTLIKDHAVVANARAWEHAGAAAIREHLWEDRCRQALLILRRSEEDLYRSRKSAPWKVAIAAWLKERSQASNPWLARRLFLGTPKAASLLVAKARRCPMPSPELVLLRRKTEA